MRAFFARRRRLSGDLRPQFSSSTCDKRRYSAAAALVWRWCALAITLFSIVGSVPLSAQETITYSYDALGRLVQVYHGTTGPNANVSASYSYDNADNRTQVVVTTSAAALTVNPATLPNATVGTAYSQTITATGGSGGYSFSLSGGNLPAGLSLSSAGLLSGTPTTATSYNFTVKATDSSGNIGTRAYTVAVGGGSVTITLAPATLAGGTVGSAYNQTITASGGTSPYTFTSAGPLPAGLTLTSAGALSGTPTTAGSSSFTVQATDSASHSGSQNYTVVVSGGSVTITLAPATLAGGTVGSAYNQTVTASGGTSPYTFAVTSGGLPTGLTLSSTGVLSGTPTTAGSFPFTVQATDSASHSGSQNYSVTVGTANTLSLSPASLAGGTVGSAYSQTITASGGTGPYTFTSPGSLPPGLTLSSGGVLSGTPTTAGSFGPFTVQATDSGANHTGSQNYTVTVSAANTLTLSPASLAGGTVGSAYSQTITASGGTSPYTFTSAGPFPPGLTLSSGGVLSGTPTTAGSFGPFTVQATDSGANHTGSQNYTVTIGNAGPITIQLASTDHNLRTVANNNGYTGSSSANYNFVVGSGVTITAASAGGAALDTGTWPSGVTLSLQVNGTVAGGGGNGGNGASASSTGLASAASAGGAGGDAIQCNAPASISVVSGGIVESGGGGGGGGGISSEQGGPGKIIYLAGGGGGGGAPDGAGGAGGAAYNTTNATAGSAGTTSGGGTGGTNGIAGGSGGTYGAAGMAGINGTVANGAAAGAAGYAVRKNGTGCSVTNSGTVTGTVG